MVGRPQRRVGFSNELTRQSRSRDLPPILSPCRPAADVGGGKVLCCEPKAGFRCCLTDMQKAPLSSSASPHYSAFSGHLAMVWRGIDRLARASSRGTKWPSTGERQRVGRRAKNGRCTFAPPLHQCHPSFHPTDKHCPYFFGCFGAVAMLRSSLACENSS